MPKQADNDRAERKGAAPDQPEDADHAAEIARRRDQQDPALARDEQEGGACSQHEPQDEPGAVVIERRQRQHHGHGHDGGAQATPLESGARDDPRRHQADQRDTQRLGRGVEADRRAVIALMLQPQRQQRPGQAGRHAHDRGAGDRRGEAEQPRRCQFPLRVRKIDHRRLVAERGGGRKMGRLPYALFVGATGPLPIPRMVLRQPFVAPAVIAGGAGHDLLLLVGIGAVDIARNSAAASPRNVVASLPR